MFSWFDLVTPIGTAILALALCTWALWKADKLIARIICGLTMSLFVLGIPVVYGMRYASLVVNYTTPRGLGVVQGDLNRCEPATVVFWETELVEFWTPHYAKAGDALRGKRLVCKDQEKISISGVERFFRGYTDGVVAVIGWRDPIYAHSLFRHELSHVILTAMGVPYNEAIQHQKMLEYQLGD